LDRVWAFVLLPFASIGRAVIFMLERAAGTMPYEIERKFLVQSEGWRTFAGRGRLIRQGYLTRNGCLSLRIRMVDDARAMLTIKTASEEIRRLEFEYEIPRNDGATLLGMRQSGLIEKMRHELPWHGLTWEIDVFLGDNHGLVVAEIEVPHEEIEFEKPDWLGPEVTFDPRYSNASLAKRPFHAWSQDPSLAHVELISKFNSARRI
jgi:adenylate cyclase